MAGAGPQISRLVSWAVAVEFIYLAQGATTPTFPPWGVTERLSLCMSLFALLNGLLPSRQKRKKDRDR